MFSGFSDQSLSEADGENVNTVRRNSSIVQGRDA